MSKPENQGTLGFRLFGRGPAFGVQPASLLQCYRVRGWVPRFGVYIERFPAIPAPKESDAQFFHIAWIKQIDPFDRLQGYVEATVDGYPNFLAWMSGSYKKANPKHFIGYGPRTPGFPIT